MKLRIVFTSVIMSICAIVAILMTAKVISFGGVFEPFMIILMFFVVFAAPFAILSESAENVTAKT